MWDDHHRGFLAEATPGNPRGGTVSDELPDGKGMVPYTTRISQ